MLSEPAVQFCIHFDPATPQPQPPAGPPKHHYRLHSVVSHRGSSSNSGHYVADVYRFDTASWWRYDDTVVTQTRYIILAVLIILTGSPDDPGRVFLIILTVSS